MGDSTNPEFYQTFTDSIQKLYRTDFQTKQVYEIKQEAIYELEECAKKCHIAKPFKNTLRVWLTGSSVNGFGNKNSDADMCLVTGGEQYGDILPRKSIVNLLHQMKRHLEQERRYLLERAEVIPAKVPILRVFLKIRNSVVQCDVNVDNHIGIRNSWLLRCYSELDDRVRPFIYMIKKFAKAADLNDAQSGSMSTYSWLLLAISFLQVGLEHPVLPVVQNLKAPDGKFYDEHFKSPNLEKMTGMALRVKSEIKWKSQNTMTAGELFYKFLFYYSLSLNFKDWIISIRTGKLFMRLGDESLRNLQNSIAELKATAEIAAKSGVLTQKSSGRNKSTPNKAESKRERSNSGMFVKKTAKNETIELSDDDEDEDEDEQSGSIVKKSSDEEPEKVAASNTKKAPSRGKSRNSVSEMSETKEVEHEKKSDPEDGEIEDDNKAEEAKEAEVTVISSGEEAEEGEDMDEEEGEDSTDEGLESDDPEILFNEAIKIFGNKENAEFIYPSVKHKHQVNANMTQFDLNENSLVLLQRQMIEKAATNKVAFNYNDFPLDRITICIEEPFQKDNVARAVYDKEKALRRGGSAGCGTGFGFLDYITSGSPTLFFS